MGSIRPETDLDRFIGSMRERGVILKVDEENNLDIDAPKGVLEQSFVEAIRSRKQELLDYLRNITHNAGAEGSIPRAPVLPAYDLSSSQMNVWITNEIWDDHTVNNIDTTMVWTADFDPVKFEHAVQAMIERHEILRTVFREDGNGKVMQVVLPPEQVDFRLSYFDFRYEQDRYEKREILLREDANKPFNLRTGPLLRVTLYRLEEETYYIHPTMHHIISDGWSLTVLIREVFIYYEALIKGEPAALEPLRIHYKDYAAWQQEQLHTEKFREHQLYWTARFRESWQLLDLFAGNVRPAVQTINGRVLRTVINETLATRLKEFCLKQKGSLFMGLVALLRVFLYRYTGQKDLVLGTPVAGRNHPDLHNQIGYYINTLALRTPLQEGDTFTGLFDRVRTDVMNAFEHQDYPFNKLLEDIAVKRDLSRNALFDIMIGLQNFSDNPDHNYAAAGMEDAIEDWGYSRPRYDLFFEFIEMGNELDMRLEFNTDIYDKAAMHRLIAHYKCLLEALLAQPSAPVAEVDYLSPAERKQLLTAFNDTAVVYPADKTMLDLFAAQVEQRPSGIAVVDEEGNAISYQELDERASALARYLRSCGVQQETLVPLLQERSVELIVSMLAVLKAGGAYLPIDPSYPQERVAYMLSDTGAGLIIAHSKYARLLEAQETLHRVYIDRDRALPDNLHEVLPPQVQPSGLAYIIYTSGSTGQPKGVMITHTSVVNLVHWHINRYDVKPGAHATAMLGPGFDAFALEVWSALLSGAALYIVGDELKLDPAALLDFYKANGITHTFVPTALVQGLVSQEQPEGLLLKYVLIGGDRLPEVAIGHLSYTLVNQYGPTESTVMVTDYPILEQTGKQPPIGKPLWNTYVRILDSHQGLVPVGVAGELCIGGVQLARGYLNKPELTASRFISDPYLPGERLYRTGDQARWLPDGNIAFIGRIDDQVKIRGYRIEPGDVEHGLLRVPGIRAAVVKVVFEENGAASLAGYFTSEEPLSPAQIRAQLSGHLPAYMVPAYLVEVEGFTLTPNGKVDKDCLPHPSELGLVSGVEYVAPVNAVEHALAEVYGEVLKRERVSVQDSFFDLGGDSIKAILLINRLKQRGYTVKVGDVLKYPVIAEVAKHTRVVTPEAPENNKPLQEGFTYRQLLPEELEAICSAGEVSDIYELSPLQEGIYYHWLAEPGTTAYVQQTSYRMKGALQVKVIQESYEYLVARHAVLRTSFSHEYGSRNLQIVRKQVQAGFIYQDIGNLEDKEAYVTHYKQQDRKKGFDLGSGSQMRLSVLDLGGEEYELVWSHHHILMDGWCATVLINEFYVIYQYLLNDRPPLLDKPAAYVNYIRWLFRQDKARSLQYWKEYLAAYGSLAAIPFREKAQEGTPYVLAETHLMLDAEKLAAIQAVCRQAEVTENTFVQSAWAYLLSCYNHTQDVVFGAVVSGRPGELDGVDTMMGLFINTIPVRIAYDDSTTARSLLKKVQQEAIASLPYHYLQLSEIQAESPLGNKLFDHVLGFLNYPEELNIPGTAAETGGLEKLELLSQDAVNESNYDFNIITFLVPGGMWVIFRYNAAVYSAASVQRIKEHFAGVLEGFMTGADSPLTAMDYLPAGERHQLLYDFNDTAFPYPDAQSIPDLFAGWVERVGDSAALVHEGRTLSYRELDEQSNQLAHYLQRQGVGEGSVVPVLLDRSLELVLSLLAVLKAGGAYVPVDPAYPAERISYMLSDTGSRLLLTHSYYTDLLEDHASVQQVCIDRDWSLVQAGEVAAPGVGPSSSSLAYVIYTSGSTGQPKGVMIAHTAVVNLVHWHIRRYGVAAGCRSTAMAGVGFDAFALEVWSALLSGSTLYLVGDDVKLDAGGLLAFYAGHGITHAFVPPALIPGLVSQEQPEGLLLKYVLIGGDRLPEVAIGHLSYTLVNQYGPTESTVMVTDYPILEQTGKQPPVGKPLWNTYVRILDSHQGLVPVGVAGELCIGGVQLARGYLNKPELTASRFIADPYLPGERLYRTGDQARWLPDGNIAFIGRIDDQVKIRGYRIEPGDVEHGLLRVPGIRAAVVKVVFEENGAASLAGYFTSEEPLSPAQVRAQLSGHLPAYMVPAYLVEVEGFTLTPNGKVDKDCLPHPSELGLVSGVEYVAPGNAVEHALAEVYGEVLKRERVSVQDSFFDLGGDSIKAILLINRLKQRGYTVKVGDVLKYPVIASLSLHAVEHAVQVSQAEVEGSVPLTPVQRWFLESSYAYKHHYNQSVLLQSRRRLDAGVLEESLSRLTRHHDGLRTVYDDRGGHWHASIRPWSAGSYVLREYDLCGRSDAVEELGRQGDILQSSIDLCAGPLVHAGLFHLDDGDRLLLVIHHLVTDGVSWRILLEDLSTLYSGIGQGAAVSLPLKSDSYLCWSERLKAYANSAALSSELPYWEGVLSSSLPVLPQDYPGGGNRVSSGAGLSFELSESDTLLLGSQVHRVYNTDINDVLLAGVGLAVADSFGVAGVVVELEGHGREELFDDLDIGRTVGWFTSTYPVVLDACAGEDARAYLVRLKEQLRQVPGKGIGYGLLRYLRDGGGVLPFDMPAGRITFNYLGDFGSGVSGATGEELFLYSGDYRGRELRADYELDHALTVTGLQVSGRLRVMVDYSRSQYDETTIAGFVNRYESLLLGLIRDLAGDEGRYVTPSDLSYRGLSMSEVSALGSGGEVEDVYELSPLQEGIYYHWLAAPGTTAYVEQSSYRLKGRVDIGLLEQSYARLLSRHAILRTAFTHEYGTSTLQIVRKTVKPDFRYIQFPPGTDIESSCAAFKEQDRAAGFDLGKGSQMRLSVLDLGNQEYEFVWSHHHILMDGWCTGILVNEFYKIYHSLVNRETPVLDNLQPYVNYIRWLSLRDRAGSLQYWEQYLSGYSNLSGIPLKENNGGKASYTPKEAHLVLGAGQLSSIQALCRQLGITENTFIQCAWGYLLSRYNNTRDVVFGSVVSGRPGELDGVEHMIGLFINTVPVRIQYEDNSTVQELLRQVQQEAIEGLPYHYVQLSDVQSRSALRKDLFDHLFIYENYPVAPSFSATGTAEQGLERLELMASAVVEQTSYDFNIAAVAADGNMLITIRYNGSCYATTSIQRIKSHLANVIREFIARPHSLLQEIGYLPEEERGHLLAAAGDAAIEEEAGLTVRDLFRKQVAVRGDTIALQFKERAYSYQAIDKMSDQLAQYLLERYGLQTGDIVGIMLPRSEWLIISMLAVLKAGCAYVPIDPAYPAGRIEYIRSDSGCRTCIDLQELEKFQAAQHSYTAAGKVNVVQEQHLAYVIYTSGSTGKPKGVMIPHSAVVNFIKGITQLISFEHKRIYALTTVSFDIFVLESILPLCTGATVILGAEEEQADPAKAAAAIIAHRIQLLQCTPSRISMMLEAGENGFLKGVSDLMIGGEAFPASLLGEIKHHYPGRIFNMYGPTETTVWSAVKDLTDEAHVTIGKPIRNTQAYILDDRLRLQGVGVYGEICLAGKGVARGYLNRDALTNEKFVPNPFAGGEKLYRTGDLGRWLPDGDIECAGRIDDQVKIRGYRIEPGEIEQLLLQLEGIDQVVVAACAAPGPAGGGKVLTAYIVGRRTYAVQALKQALKQQLPEYMIPAYFIRLDKLPLTANGKLDKLALPYPGSSNVGSSAGYVAPRNKAEQALADVYRQVLNLEQVSVLDSFFDLGGDSIRTIQLINHLKRQGYKVRVTEVLQYPVIEELARQITCIAAPEGINVRPPDVPAARMPLSPNQQWYYGKNGFAHAYGTVSFRLKGFDSTTFLDTYKRWLQHYAVLRIKILEEHGLLYQELMPVPEAPAVLFLESASLDMSSAAAIAAVHKMQQDAFDLFNGEVIRCGVIHNQYEAFVYMVIHHVATDGASNVLLRDAFMQQYGKQEWTPGNNNTYFDFITAQQHYLHSADGGEKLYYWQQHLAPLAARKNGLPAEPGKLLTGIFSENRRVLAGAAYQDIRADCRQQQVLLSSLVTTWLYLYLCDARPEESLFLVGMVADGRDACLPGFDMAGAVGQFTNQVPVCLSRDACSTFGTAVRYVQERCLDGRLHQELPWAVIAADFEGRYGSALEPYMDAVVNYFDHTDTDVDLDEWQAYSKTTPLTDMPPGPCLLVICHAFRNGLVMDWHISSHSPEQEITARIIAAMTTQR